MVRYPPPATLHAPNEFVYANFKEIQKYQNVIQCSKFVELTFMAQNEFTTCTSAFGSQFKIVQHTFFHLAGLDHEIGRLFSLQASMFLDEVRKCVLSRLCAAMKLVLIRKKFTRTPWRFAVHK